MAKEKNKGGNTPMKQEKNPNGRPLKFKTEKKLQSAIEEYFKECKEYIINDKNYPQIPTIAGLAYKLGVDRTTIYNYEARSKFFNTIKMAREYIFAMIEGKLANTNANAGGIIFLAKNYGYSDNEKKDGDLTEQEMFRLKQLIYGQTSDNI